MQEELEDAWSSATGLRERFVLAGRTDAGVHARAQVASVQSRYSGETTGLPGLLQPWLPADLWLRGVTHEEAAFNARASAHWRAYRYELRAGQGYGRLPYMDVSRMNRAAQRLLGEHDFGAFSSATKLGPRGSIRRVLDVDVAKHTGSGGVDFWLVADAFLRQMVRRIVSALLVVGTGRITEHEFSEALRLGNRNLLPAPAPGEYLTLFEVGYREYSK